MKKIARALCALLILSLLFSFAVPAAAANEETRPFENSAFFQYEGYTLHYRVFPAENEQGKIFLIHGFALSSYCFEKLALLLQEAGFTCVAADLPGFGYSSRETIAQQKLPREELMHALMTHLSSDPWYVGAHSMGGYVALGIAQSYPESVKNLLLFGTNGHGGRMPGMNLLTNETYVHLTSPLMQRAGQSAFLVRLLLFFASFDLRFTMQYDVSKITDPLAAPGTGESAFASYAALPQTDFEAVRNMPPILYLNAKNDVVIPKSEVRKLRAFLPAGSTDLTVEDGGHLFIECRAERTAETVLAFLEANR